jgi:LacI family transcriptional regulator
MKKAPASIRSIALQSGFSTWSVSHALNGGSGVNDDTRKTIVRIAGELGYRPNPLVSAVMARNRSARNGVAYNGNLAIVSAFRADKKTLPFHDEVIRAAQGRAEELGFHIEQFLVGENGLPVPQLNRILLARGIHGILDMPWNEPRDLHDIEWASFSAVRMVYFWGHPELNIVTPDYYQQFLHALIQLKQMGYRRIGLYLYPIHDQRILFKWKAIFLLFSSELAAKCRVPVLVQKERSSKDFMKWVKQHDVDLVISYSHVPLEWMREAGCRVPEERGFFSLNIHAGRTACAGLNLNPSSIGKVAVETLAAQIHRNEKGLPAHPIHISVPGEFHQGPTICVQPGNDAGMSQNPKELARESIAAFIR